MFIIHKRIIKHFDWLSFFLTLLLSALGILFIYSSTYQTGQPYSIFFKKQLFGLVTGSLFYIFFSFVDHRQLMRLGYFIYYLIIGLLVFTIIKGSIGMGAKRWINLIFFKVQPSELAKLFFPIFVAYFLKTQKDTFDFTFRDFIPLIITLTISFLLILKQPDLGTGILLVLTGLILFWLAGLGKKFFMSIFIITLVTAPLSWRMLKPYQKRRVSTFLGYGTKEKERYQIEQSEISIGSGGLWGKGVLKGTQNRLLFLPESRTDFIFSVLCEEIGFAGALFVIFLYSLLFLRMFYIIIRLNSPFLQLFATGVILHIIIATIINMFMITGLLPVVGMPLPLMSYGLSNLWTTFVSLGFLNSIQMQNS